MDNDNTCRLLIIENFPFFLIRCLSSCMLLVVYFCWFFHLLLTAGLNRHFLFSINNHHMYRPLCFTQLDLNFNTELQDGVLVSLWSANFKWIQPNNALFSPYKKMQQYFISLLTSISEFEMEERYTSHIRK